jgi:hypothetical protein
MSSPDEWGCALRISEMTAVVFGLERVARYTFALAAYRIEASSLPIPLEAPVIMKTLFPRIRQRANGWVYNLLLDQSR